MDISVKIEAPELAESISNLAIAITNIMAKRDELLASQAADKAIGKAASKKTKTEPVAPAAVAPEEPISAAEAKTPEPQVAAATITHDAVKTLAALKAKKHGSMVVRGLIADTGYAQIADIDNPAILVSLNANLEALGDE